MPRLSDERKRKERLLVERENVCKKVLHRRLGCQNKWRRHDIICVTVSAISTPQHPLTHHFEMPREQLEFAHVDQGLRARTSLADESARCVIQGERG
jgi:hypothetical protein